MMTEEMPKLGGEYQYGFKDDITPVFTTGEGLCGQFQPLKMNQSGC